MTHAQPHPAPPPPERRRCARFGFTSLLVWALFGLALEAAHGLKLTAYLDDPLSRLLLTLAHAHGALLALVVLAYGALGAERLGLEAARRVGGRLRWGAFLLPLGFASSALWHPEGDPGPTIVLVPLGAVLLLVALAETARASWRSVEP
ncbi:MAG: hypothetical protein OEY14_16655 [Myxococcales bacterium]|nr:hypothetical protein [Myxococcales bacterium]